MSPLFEALSLATLYRLLHLAGMAVLLGGAVFVAVRVAQGADGSLLRSAQRYEWLFWAAMLTQVITGIGNLGVRGAGVPGPEQPWGALLYAKLGLVLALLMASLLRSVVVARLLAEPGSSISARGERQLGLAYSATAAFLGIVLLTAVRLAHG